MAWLGGVAVIGLLVCGIDALYSVLRARKERRVMPSGGVLPEYWTHRRLGFLVGGIVSVVVLAIVGLSVVFGTAGHGSKLVVAPTTTAPVGYDDHAVGRRPPSRPASACPAPARRCASTC